jgi:hypothetical protein
MFRHFKMPSSGRTIWTCWDGAQCREKQRRMEAVYCDRRCKYAVCHNIQLPTPSVTIYSSRTPSVTIYSSHPSLLFHDIGHHLSMFISDSLMMAFWNAETCSSILSNNTLNEWCVCWSVTDHKKMHGPNCKIVKLVGGKIYVLNLEKFGVHIV